MDINQIAQMAGVSRATVSRYFNNGYVSQEKREIIAKVIEKTGYAPSQQAKTLRTGKTNVVGVIIPKINSTSISRIVAGISQVVNDAGYQVLLANTANDAAREVEFLKLFQQSNQVDGAILVATMFSPEHYRAMDALRVPLVIVDQITPDRPCVYQDDLGAVRTITGHILKTSSNPAYIGVDEDDVSAGQMRREGFLAACEQAGIQVPLNHITVGDFSIEAGYDCTEQLLDADPTIDAIVCATDTIACGALTCLRDRGLSVPGDVQVTGIGDGDLSQIVDPPLTTIHHHYKSTGIEAAKMLLGFMSKDAGAVREVKMGFDLVERKSTR